MTAMQIAIYPGTFDPITNGHLDVLERACRIFSRVIIAVARNAGKNPIFSHTERMALIQEALPAFPKAEARTYDGLTVDFARSVGAGTIIRGLRAVSDFEYEFQMAQMNRQLDPGMETIFLMPCHEYFYTSSSLIKQVSQFSTEKLSGLVPPHVIAALEKRRGAS